ncbi:maltose alpha-D-glucosyltransferase [Rhodococcus fascians]|jgi:trehalose synthase|uniref:maltose alpha-D-glucosyltransferase n=1 Tax=Nocardiaceae TaxID=85025 RepID=UPI000B9B0C27|nr:MULTISPECIES: maltose alpha-D-glucosyltransferase [Rhodococcus]OZD52824.1 maltose alpha-D-glucosyltransferase [Rhodococcus sp. 06-1477-1B]MBY3791476.1 maltose alpha-D-glucosyltransferase [Rhodococcus fascians]MBY3824172.1 maltose alpha-D-glucosyltransferase [Rhodococcus fascians]MBY3834694.1 maltose alpha-D-glucosyltransferase [Rhodococcus fascians]MBY3863906.1 maltose alpha-D-glucosyltransferase [Rhodococcus fascians]
MDPEVQHEPSEITYDEKFYPARPKPLRPSVRRANRSSGPTPDSEPVASNPEYVDWLTEQSMLRDAKLIAEQLSGKGSMWQNPYADPDPRAAVERAPVWFTAYPISVINAPQTSFLSTLGDEKLWQAFSEIGVTAVHTGPVKVAGGIHGWRPTPSVDGHFDRIGMQIDPAFGSEEEFRRLCVVAAAYDGIVIDDIVPGHTGKGADFRLAEMAVADYPGIYHMVEIEPQDWHLLPRVRAGADSQNIDAEAEANLARAGYIIGQLQRVIFYELGVKETNWSATPPVVGIDGVERRWVYLHYFKAGQPSINWLDPSFAGMRLVIGDACHSIADLGAGALRLDANGFLGVERRAEGPGWSEGHPLSEAANHLIASVVRKMGGFTFQELNLTIDDIKAMGTNGADLSYDFINRPAYQHALVMGNTEFLRLTMTLARDHGVDTASLVHALQNHDEMTFELIHFATLHAEDEFAYGGESVKGCDLGDRIRGELTDRLTGRWAPYNRTFTTNGIACTTASVITASLGIRDLDRMDEQDIETVKRAHLLLAMYNALQPGVFALSGWDLLGILPIAADEVEDLIKEGDTRWLNRGAHDLMGYFPDAVRSESGIPRGRSLYGSLPEQLADPQSFARQLARIIELRNKYGIATAQQIDIPTVSHKSLLVMVHELGQGTIQATVLNFSSDEISATIQSKHLVPGTCAIDVFDDNEIATVDELHSFPMNLGPYEGVAVVLR